MGTSIAIKPKVKERGKKTLASLRSTTLYALILVCVNPIGALCQSVTENCTIAFDPASPVTGDKLKAIFKVSEAEGLSMGTLYNWKINGRSVQESPTEVLEYPIKEGEYVEVTVYPGYGHSGANSVKSAVIVGNAPPDIRLTWEKLDENGNYEANLDATDPEGDPITLTLIKGPEQMIIDPSNKTLKCRVPLDVESKFSVEVSAKDSDGGETALRYDLCTALKK